MEQKEVGLTQYKTLTGEDIKLTPEIVKRYLVSGKAELITPQEIMMFLTLCKYQKLNPFLKECYLIKYSANSPATLVTGKDTFLKRAVKNPHYQGHKTGIIGEGEAAWAEVYVKGYKCPIRVEVDYSEYVGMKDEYKDNKKTGKKVPNSMWSEKPKTMLKKVALVQALREAFPEDFSGMYSFDEIKEDVSTNPIDMPTYVQQPKAKSDSKAEVISPDQVKRLFAIANDKGWTKAQAKELYCGVYGFKSSKDITTEHYEQICKDIEDSPKVEPESVQP